MTDLEQNLNDIYISKEMNLLPENLKKGITCLGIEGTLDIPVKLFSTIEEMNQSTENKEEDLAIVYKPIINNWQVDTQSNAVYFPKTVTLEENIEDKQISATFKKVDTSIETEFYFDARFEYGMNYISIGIGEDYKQFDYTRKSSSEGKYVYERSDSIEDEYVKVEIPFLIEFDSESIFAREWNEIIGYFIKTDSKEFDGIYIYKDNIWKLAEAGVNATNEYVYNKKYYGKNGIGKGTIADNPSLYYNDINAEIYQKLKDFYNNANPITIEEGWKPPKDIKSIPTKDDGTPLWDTSSLTSTSEMFKDNVDLKEVALLDLSNVTDTSSMFENCYNLEKVATFNTSSVTNMSGMFAYCRSIKEIPFIDTSKVTNMRDMFADCTEITTIPAIDTSSAINTSNLFYGCYGLTEVPFLNTSNVTDMSGMFCMCTKLKAIPQIDTSKVTNMRDMFEHTYELETIPVLDTSSLINARGMFRNANSLSDESINNILLMLANAKNYTDEKTLKFLEFPKTLASKCSGLSNYQKFSNAGWTTGY